MAVDGHYHSHCNSTTLQEDRIRCVTWDDATWILSTSFIIFTMQSGFGLLESGLSSAKNEVNIMVKNVVDVVFGGLSYWLVGFGLTFGNGKYSNGFFGNGLFAVEATDEDMGWLYSWYIFQFSFATTSTTIVSGAMAERAKLSAYIIFSFFNTLVYAIPARWLNSPRGFLYQMGAIDIAGAGTVHLVGGTTGLIATLMLKPRINRFNSSDSIWHQLLRRKSGEHCKRGSCPTKQMPPVSRVMGCPTNALLGLFMLWWGWLGFNCGSTYGISGGKWKLASRSAVVTIMSSVGGGTVGVISGYLAKGYCFLPFLINGILGSLVSVTGLCALAHPYQAVLIGAIGSILANVTEQIISRFKIDDPVGVIPVHFVCSIWAMIATGLFVQDDPEEKLNRGLTGVFVNGEFKLLELQALAILCLLSWSVIVSSLLLYMVDKCVGLRLGIDEESLGSDWVEHRIGTVSSADLDKVRKLTTQSSKGIFPSLNKQGCCIRLRTGAYGFKSRGSPDGAYVPTKTGRSVSPGHRGLSSPRFYTGSNRSSISHEGFDTPPSSVNLMMRRQQSENEVHVCLDNSVSFVQRMGVLLMGSKHLVENDDLKSDAKMTTSARIHGAKTRIHTHSQ